MKRRLNHVRRVSGALAGLVVFGACGGGGGDGGITNPPPPPPPAAVASVAVSLAPATINVTQTSQATAVVRDAQNNVLTGRTVTWTSSNTSVATVSSSSGLVTGIAAGTANIIATSEGRTSQALLTVTAPAAPPQISALSITQNGQSANLSNVAGTLTVNFNVDVPAGFSGTLIVRVDTIEFLRRPISAPFIAGHDAVAQPVIVGETVNIETAKVVAVVDAQSIREVGVLRNLAHLATITVQPNAPGGQSGQQQFNFTTNNPVHAHGLYGFASQAVIGIDGKAYTGDDGTGAVVFATYGSEVINGFEVILTRQQTLYGRPGGGVVDVLQRITRTNLDKFTLPEAPIEGSNLTYILDKVTINGITLDPQVDYLGNAMFTTDLVGSGFANTPQQVLGLTPAAGLSYLQLSPHLTEQIPGAVKGQWTLDAFNLDNVPPQQTSAANAPVFSFLDRLTAVGGPSRHPSYGFGAFNGQLSGQYEFEGGLRYDRLGDLSGVDQTKTEYYAGPISNQQNLFTPQYKIGAQFTLSESNGSRLYTAGARVFDKRGNWSDFSIRTSSKNGWNVGGSISLGGNLGVDIGAFGYSTTRASLNLTAMPTESTWNQSSFDPSTCWLWTVSGSTIGIPDGFLSMRAKLNGTYGLGAGTLYDDYQVVGSSGGTTSGTATVFMSPAISQIYSRVGGPSNQGLYEFEFKAADNAGRYIGDMMYPKTYKLLYDYSPPTNPLVTYSGTVTAGQPANGTLTGSDNWGLKYGRLGIRFNYSSPLFFGNQVYVPVGEIPIAKQQDGSPMKSLSMPITGTAPIGFSFYNPVSGAVDAAFYRSNGTSFQLEDYARNLSSITFAPFGNSAAVPTIRASSVKSSLSTSTWCPGTCSGGGQNLVDLIFNYLDPLASGPPELSKAEWFGIPQNAGGMVYRLGSATTMTSVVEGTGRRISYNMQLDLKNYCGPSGPMDVFVIGYNTGYYLKTNPFYPVNVQAPARYSNECLKLKF